MSDSEKRYAELEEKFNLLKGLLDNLPGCAPYRIVCNADGTIAFGFMGAQVQTMLGYSAEEALADKDVAYSRIHPEDMPLFILRAEEARRNGVVFDCTARHRTKSGEYKLMRTCSIPRTDEQGRMIFDGYLLDVEKTRHRMAHQNRTDNLAELLAPLETSEDLVLLLDKEGLVEYANKAAEKQLTLDRSQLLGQDILGIQDAATPIELMAAGWSGQLNLNNASGELKVEGSLAAIHDDNTGHQSFLAVFENVEKIKKELPSLQERLAEIAVNSEAERPEGARLLRTFVARLRALDIE